MQLKQNADVATLMQVFGNQGNEWKLVCKLTTHLFLVGNIFFVVFYKHIKFLKICLMKKFCNYG